MDLLKAVELPERRIVGIRRLNYGLYNVLVGIRTGRKTEYYRVGSIRNGAYEAKTEMDVGPVAELASSGPFQQAVRELLDFAAVDSVMSE